MVVVVGGHVELRNRFFGETCLVAVPGDVDLGFAVGERRPVARADYPLLIFDLD